MNNILTPGKLAERIQNRMELDKESSERFGKELFSILIRELKKEDHFSIFGFGSFKKLFVHESQGRNPQTGEHITIPSHYRIKFTPSGKLSERINSEYAHLHPVILEEETVHEGLLLKAERYILSIPAEPEPLSEPLAVSQPEILEKSRKPAEKPSESGDHHIEPDFGFKNDRRKKFYKILPGFILLLVLSLGIIWFLTKKDSAVGASPRENIATEIQNPKQSIPEETLTVPKAQEPSPAVSSAKIAGPEDPGTSYRISPGDSFSILAKEQWGNIYLWPFIYSSNRTNYPDPDLIRPGDKIHIPPQPDTAKDQVRIEDSILMAYKRYRDLIREQTGSPKNPRRELSAGYVLVGGEKLYPTFLRRNSNLIRPEDIRRAEDLNP